jgi:CSLREA domain-containing protein
MVFIIKIKRTAMKTNLKILVSRIGLTALVVISLAGSIFQAQPVRAESGTTINVNTFVDEMNVDGDCSLREAIHAANTDSGIDACPAGVGSDSIFLPAGTYTLGIAGTGEDTNFTGDLDVTASQTLYIKGDQNHNTIISGGFGDRVLHVTNPNASLFLSDLTISNGLTFEEPGGGILSIGLVNLNRVYMFNNSVLGNTTSSVGGGLSVGNGAGTGSAFILSSVFKGNAAWNGSAIFSNRDLSLERSAVIQNNAQNSAAIFFYNQTLLINSTLISDNTVTSGTFTAGLVVNASLAGSSITNATISHNQNRGLLNAGNLTIANTIMANNTVDCESIGGVLTSLGYNLVSDASCPAILVATGDQKNINPALLPLEVNAKGMWVRPLSPGSPAIDSGSNAACPSEDQRGIPRPLNGDLFPSAVCDRGAFEFAQILYVDDSALTGLSNGGSWANAFILLQDALQAATPGTSLWVAKGIYFPDIASWNYKIGDRNATFKLKDRVNVYGGFAGTETSFSQRGVSANPTILSGDIDHNDTDPEANGIIEDPVQIVGNNAYHVVTVDQAVTPALNGVTITAGDASVMSVADSGGGMLNMNGATPDVIGVTFQGNRAVYAGGAMLNTSGAAPYIADSQFIGNKADFGGAIFNQNAPMVQIYTSTLAFNMAGYGGAIENLTSDSVLIENSTLAYNTATTGYGGAIYNADSANLTLKHVTMHGNIAAQAGYGGGVMNNNASLLTINTIISNSGASGDCQLLNGATLSSTNSLFQDAASACGAVNHIGGNIVGRVPILRTLLYYGGPTQTMLLASNSPAINAGNLAQCAATDQRGSSRPRAGGCDMGAVEMDLVFVPGVFR